MANEIACKRERERAAWVVVCAAPHRGMHPAALSNRVLVIACEFICLLAGSFSSCAVCRTYIYYLCCYSLHRTEICTLLLYTLLCSIRYLFSTFEALSLCCYAATFLHWKWNHWQGYWSMQWHKLNVKGCVSWCEWLMNHGLWKRNFITDVQIASN